MLDLASIVQTATGVASTPSTAVTFSSATAAGNGVMIRVLHDAGNFVSAFPAGFSLFDPGGGTGQLNSDTMCKDSPGGETSYTVTMGGTAAPALWFAMELAGGMSMDARNPDISSFSLCFDFYLIADAELGPASSVDSGASLNSPTIWGDVIALAFAGAHKASGVPPTITGSVTNTVDGSAPAWTRLCPTAVTSTGTNDIRMDVFYSVSAGTLHQWAAKPTWTASTDLVASVVTGVRGFFIPPQLTAGRAATNSTN